MLRRPGRADHGPGGRHPRRGSWHRRNDPDADRERDRCAHDRAVLRRCLRRRVGFRARRAGLVPLERIVLSEVDSGFVGQPWALAVARDGRFLVADGAARRILVFGRDGRFVGGIGRPGSGPGEFAAPTWLALGGDSLVYALDNPRVLAFDQRSGAFRWARSFPRRLSMLAAHGDRLFAGYPDSLGNGSVAVLDGDTSTFRVIGPFPELLRFPPIRMMAGTVAVAVERDELATAYAVTDRVYISRIDGDVLDSIAVPAVRRQGAQTELLRRFAESPWDVEVAERAIYGSSAPLGLHWLPSGMLALVTVDARVEQGRIVGENFLSVIDRGGAGAAWMRRSPDPVSRSPGWPSAGTPSSSSRRTSRRTTVS
jgi:hypothetical protein